MKKLALIGISGRMGQEIHALAKDFDLQVTSGLASKAKSEGGVEIVATLADLRPENIDVVIDFSLPELTDKVIAWCTKNAKPLVSGVTGLSDAQKAALRSLGQTSATLWSPNMSLGVAVMARMLAQFKKLEGFDFQIEELHHIRKKDKPSGTALFLQEKLTDAVGPQVPDPLAIRGGGIFGVHRVWAMGEEETLTIEHTAMNRRVFARGALKAASWILKQKPGIYLIDDVLGA
jgi:4-hydroxy-tetrahydrodipicolinate reductase